MKLSKIILIAGAAFATAPAFAHPPIAERLAAEEAASFEADRRDILAMAGNFRVRFDMQESTPWVAGYTPLDRKISGGHEVVRVVEDTGRRIVLQHMLVVEMDGQQHVIKHWRQDWVYEPANVLVYSDRNTWTNEDIPERQRNGRWSQTVWQVDDSPRYGSWGQFETQGGLRRWRSNWTWRPLARRDAIRDPVYDRYLGINRHQPTPTGWLHWQDNIKMKPGPNGLEPVVQEYVLNTYDRFEGFNFGAADAYWRATSAYWAAVRAEWDAVLTRTGAIRIQEEARTGNVVAGRLLEMADEIQGGRMQTPAAIAEAQRLIREATSAQPATPAAAPRPS